MEKKYQNLNSVVKLLKSIAVDDKVPGSRYMYKKYGSALYRAVKEYGGYKAVVKNAGLEIKKSITASDGHVFNSYYEFLFDEYLYLNGIQHSIDGKICPSSNCRYDFKIDNVYIEIWGITKKASDKFNNYCERRLKKEKLYKNNLLQLISIEGQDFKKNSQDLQIFFKNKLLEMGIVSKDKQIKYPVFNSRKLDYWNDKTILAELKKFPCFPTARDLLNKREDLRSAIQVNGGYRKFARLLNVEPRRKEFSEEYVIDELKKIEKSIGHYPNDRELQKMKRSDLAGMIKRHGGYGHFKEKVDGERNKRPFGYWRNEENIIAEMEQLKHKLGRPPKYSELGQIAKGVDKSKKGMRYFIDILQKETQ